MARLPLFDSHAHMDCEHFDEDRAQVFEEIEQNLAGMINPGCDRESSLKAMEFAAKYKFVYAAVGWHPEEIARMVDEDLTLLKQWANNDKVVAIGEIGLDYYNDDNAPHPLQRQRFIEQLNIAKETGLPVILHDREAHGEILDILKNEVQGVKGVFHCYSGSVEMAKELIKMGWYFGFGGSSTFTNAKKVREVLNYVPEDRILFETDSPYLTPMPLRGKRNNPTYTELVAENAARVRGVGARRLMEVSTLNLKKLFFKIK
ncbi:MAG: TatD family hydrolase [Acidaminococcaceae bacterium]|nr:TatD family hydrolase [Acidaminococcaceae bacterium]